MKKLLAVSLFLLVLTLFAFSQEELIVKASGFIGAIIRSGQDVGTGSLKMQTSNATTSPAYIQNGLSTSTLTFDSQSFSSISVFGIFSASTTNLRSPLQITVKTSDDNIDFFNSDPTKIDETKRYAGGASINLASSSVPFTLLPSTATSTFSFNISLVPSRYTQISFDLASTVPGVVKDGGTIWANIVGQIK